MTEAEWASLERYVRDMADRLGLRDYDIEIARQWCDSDDHASVKTMGEKQWAELSVSSEFRTRPPEHQRKSIIHELLHAHFSACTSLVATGLSETTGKPFAAAFYRAWNDADERAVDALARAIGPFYPLPEWPKEAEHGQAGHQKAVPGGGAAVQEEAEEVA